MYESSHRSVTRMVALGPIGIEIADPPAHLAQAVEVEAAKAKLNPPRVVEASVGGEISVQPLGKRRETSDSLRTVEEGWCSRDHEVEAGVATLIDLIDQLPKRVQCSVADIGANTLQRLDLVKHEHESRVASAPKDRQQSTEEGEGTVVVEFPANSSHPLDRCGDVGLAAEPSEKSLGHGRVPGRERGPIGAEDGGQGRGLCGDGAETALSQGIDCLAQRPASSFGSVPAEMASSWSANSHESTTVRSAPPAASVVVRRSQTRR